ncbi:DUF6505 family protein [Stappia sp.]|jgi:hypothetical protein|uniref:DUF6505 family protein n=1 Tax=Stappia sp. TaxID=1870903 RepID=UPI003A99978D
MKRLLKAIRLDQSDTRVFPTAAEPGDWLIPGTFAFRAYTQEGLSGKVEQAFLSGFLSLGNFGWSTFATADTISQEDLAGLIDRLAAHFVEEEGAPSVEAARSVAEAEIADACDLAEGVEGSALLTIERTLDEEGQLHERFQLFSPDDEEGEEPHARVWDVEEDD